MLRLAAAAAIGLAVTQGANAADMTGAGSTFAFPILAKWAEAYKAAKGSNLNYQSIGSGGGINQIEAKTVDFGATDKPLDAATLAKNGLTQFPFIMGGVVLIINLPGVEKGQLTLDGATLANIYLGHITKWNDPAITKLNPGLKLSDTDIATVTRSDGSGTTFNFTDYLSKMSPEWKDKVGEDTAVQWPAAGLGGKGNEGVSALAARTVGAIGYVEYAYALQNNLVYTKLVNKNGKTVAPSLDTFTSAAANADWKDAPGFDLVITDQPGDNSWPITASTWALMQTKTDKAENAKQVLDFFDWAYKNGKPMTDALAYVAMPTAVVPVIQESWKKNIADMNGKPVWTGPGS
jgi:phosphate transport system substrate-binding protein